MERVSRVSRGILGVFLSMHKILGYRVQTICCAQAAGFVVSKDMLILSRFSSPGYAAYPATLHLNRFVSYG
jgi:hypothetical protein